MSATLLEQYRPALTGHCYRMLGSVVDAEDAVQEAMLRAWKGMEKFREQSSMKTWLYRIATNLSLDTLASTGRRRLRPVEISAEPGVVSDDLVLTQRARDARPAQATLSMPPFELWLQGHESIAKWLSSFGIGCKGSRQVPVGACGGTPAFAQYRDGGATPWALLMIELSDDRITSMTSYLDVGTLFPRFGVPMRLTP